jgi:hypothetical protein
MAEYGALRRARFPQAKFRPTTSGATAVRILHWLRGSWDIEHFGPAHDEVELEALGMPGDHLPEDPRARASSPGV